MKALALPPPERRYLDELIARVRARLGDELVGVWALGSSALGAYEAGRSDLDVQIVSTSRVPLERRLALAEALRHRSLPCPALGLELVWYALDDVRPLAEDPFFQLNLNTGACREEKVQPGPGGEAAHWFVLDLAAGREIGVALEGPPLAEVVAPIPRAMLLAALAASLEWHERFDAGSPNRVLNAARSLCWAETGAVVDKIAGARWLREAAPDLAPGLDAALEARREGRWLEPGAGAPVLARLREALGRA
ncbi:MAG TPA: aminoglycoside adenylyltransferase domain-containing protein [Polyangiaceae bacterium]|nr:aminoglycoside adenylyltransferase domain-containing protein [Polyangiaceae bacterium]